MTSATRVVEMKDSDNGLLALAVVPLLGEKKRSLSNLLIVGLIVGLTKARDQFPALKDGVKNGLKRRKNISGR